MATNFDASKFLAGLRLADARVVKGAKRAIALGLAHGERRAKKLVPIDQRHNASGGTLAATITGDAKTITVDSRGISGKLQAGGGEASDYALVQHEQVLTHTHPTSGTYASKYIETPLKELSGTIGELAAIEIRKELDAGGGAPS